MDIKILENLLQETIGSGKPERPSPPGYSKEDYGQSCLVFSREEKWSLRSTIDQGNLRKLLGI